jgi:GGDEF domain-containing protein
MLPVWVLRKSRAALYPANSSDVAHELMKKVDKAMYAAEAAGRSGYRFVAGQGFGMRC